MDDLVLDVMGMQYMAGDGPNHLMAAACGEAPSSDDLDVVGLHRSSGPEHFSGVPARNSLPAGAVTRAILKQAQSDVSAPTPMMVVPLEDASDVEAAVDLLGCHYRMGEDAAVEAAFPLTTKIYRKFDDMIPEPKVVRMDTEESYADFVSKRDFLELDRRVRELRKAIEEHESDKHGPKTTALRTWEDILGASADVLARKEAPASGQMVPLSLPPGVQEATTCWQEGDRVVCSVRVPHPDGNIRILTTSTPVAEHAEAVARYVDEAHPHLLDVIEGDAGLKVEVVGVAQKMAGGSLVPQLCAATPCLVADDTACVGGPVLRKMVPATSPTTATLMSLAQFVQSGDPQAKAEWSHLVEMAHKDKGLADAMTDSVHRLSLAQALKASAR